MKTLLWLDDIRDPREYRAFWPITPDEVRWVVNFDSFKNYIEKNGVPYAVAFDHDLGIEHYEKEGIIDPVSPEGGVIRVYNNYKEFTGLECAMWLGEYCKAHNVDFPVYSCHSANPVGKERILGVCKSYTLSLNRK